MFMMLQQLALLVLGSLLVLAQRPPPTPPPDPVYDGRYLILAPNTIRPGLPLSLSATIYETVGSNQVNLQASIIKGNDQVVSSVSTLQVGTKRITLQIPSNAVPGADYSLRVVGSGGLSFNETRDLEFNVEHFSIFVQSDKAIYKPGQTVRFRVMAVYPNLRPYVGPFSVSVKDANGNVIQQWIDREPNQNGIISEEMVMSSQPVLGEWTIKAEAEGQTHEYTFKIDEYVLPKFEVTMTLPPFIDAYTQEIPVSVSAQYTYGKPVEGTLSVYAGLYSYQTSRYQNISITKEINGKGTVMFHRIDILTLKASTSGRVASSDLWSGERIQFAANVTETLTGITLSTASILTHYDVPIKVEFSTSVSRSNFKPGLPYQAYLVVSHQDGGPLTAEERDVGLQLQFCKESCYAYPRDPQYWNSIETPPITPHTGVVEVFIPTSHDSEVLQIEAVYNGVISVVGSGSRSRRAPREYTAQTTQSISKSESDSGTYLQVRAEGSSALTVGSQASFHVQATEAPGTLTYQIVSQGNIIVSERVSGVTGTEYTIQREITRDMSPKSKLLIYFIDRNGEVILDSLEFVVDVVFENHVTASFSRDDAKPGDTVNFDVETTPGAFVGILTVDKSVLLLADGNDITRDQVLQSMGRFDTTPQDSGGWNPFFDVVFCYFPYYTSGDTAGSVLKNAGIIYITDGNVLYQEFEPPLYFFDAVLEEGVPQAAPFAPDAGAVDRTGGTGNEILPKQQIRKDFPETWLWVDTEADASGRVSISSRFPDTITSWVGTAISMNTTVGLAVTENAATAIVSKNFFVSLNLPYSVIRGEKFVLSVTVFNYMQNAITANVQLQSSKDYIILNYTNKLEKKLDSSLTKQVSIPAGAGVTLNFPIEPTKIGMIELLVTATSGLEQDGVSRFLLVEPEGVAQEYVSSDLVDFSAAANNAYSKTFSINLPQEVVPDSVRAVVTATGDILGPTMNNLDQLLRMPTGCGEQTMIAFAPDVFIYKYLKELDLSNPVIEQQALNFMKTGYQRELTYQHRDGSFSAWGEREETAEPGNTWLTAFVVRSFLQASPYIYIDPSKVELALTFLLAHKNRDGSFQAVGTIIDRGIEGGVSSVETLTAYVAIALDQARSSTILSAVHNLRDQSQTALTEALGYLEGRYDAIQEDKYAMAIVTYALVLGGSSMVTRFRTRLDELQTSEGEGSLRYWTDQEMLTTPASEDFYYRPWRGPPSAAIEMTGYGLLAYIAADDMASSVPVARWLSQQRNSLGGYSSTQDTVIGLMALTSYAQRLNANNKQMSLAITATDDATYRQEFEVVNANSIVLQQFELPVVNGNVTVAGTGTGSFLLSFILHYNLNDIRSNEVFDIEVTISDAMKNSIVLTACGSYTGPEEGTGMAIMDIGLPSGFYALEDTLGPAVNEHEFATKYEIMGQSVIIYFSEIPTTQICMNVQAQRYKPVAGTKPSVVKIYNYYKPTDQTVVTYSARVLAEAGICEVCADCCPVEPGPGGAHQTSSTSVIFLLTLALVSILGAFIL